MQKITEILVGNLSLADTSQRERQSYLVERINKVINPPRKATVENVNIRAMYLLNDLVNSHGGRFRRADLLNLCRLLLDTPVLIGHNRAESPSARTFHAELEAKGDVLWLKSYFYWPRAGDGQKDELLEKIDSGVLKECSISFIYAFPECSVCAQDIRNCPHEIDAPAGDSGKTHFVYRGITQVLETSLVYKGSVKGTYVTGKLWACSENRLVVNVGGSVRELSILPEELDSSRAVVIQIGSTNISTPEVASCPSGFVAALAKRDGCYYALVRRCSNYEDES